MGDRLNTARGLAEAVADAGSWADLSRLTGIPASTLKSRALRLGVKPRGQSAATLAVEGVDELASAIAHGVVATVIELEKGHPIEPAWQLLERTLQRDISEAIRRLVDELLTIRRGR